MTRNTRRRSYRALEVETFRRSFDADGVVVPYVVKWSREASYCRLEFDAEEGLTAVIPLRLGDEALADLLASKRKWIRRCYDEYMRRYRVVEQRRLRDGGPFMFLGTEYQLRVSPRGGRAGGVRIEGDVIYVNVAAGDEAGLRRAVTRWLRQRARAILGPLVEEYGRLMGVNPHRLFIRDQKTRWASCSGAHNLNFNFHIAMAPPEVIRYLVAHELAHLRSMRHGKRFRIILAKYYPQHAEAEKWLRQNEDLLVF